MYACRVITGNKVQINPGYQSTSWSAVYTNERTIAPLHVRYKQPHTLGTQTDLRTSVCTHTRNYKDTSVHGQPQAPMYTTCVAQAIHAKYCTGTKYSVRAQARGPSHDRCITQAVHAKCGTGTSTACEPKHAGTIGASLRLFMP